MARSITIKAGDTLADVALAAYGNTEYAQKLAAYNGITNPNLLFVGEQIELPAKSLLEDAKPRSAARKALNPPHGYAAICKTFGNITEYIGEDGHLRTDWEAEMLAAAAIPFSMPLSWDRGKRVKAIYCHKLLTPIVSDLFGAIQRAGLQSQIKSFGGCFNYRPKRQASKLSTHCWGISIDINPETNLQGSTGDIHPELVDLFRNAGFIWGGYWSGKHRDPMHFQYCTGY